jgi:tetratricopeptide (TPR) repeat protein/tRNA A-37 threonylcarbamoyl transferase component Bud32
MIGQILSHYKIIEELGEGGMGVVYKAVDMDLKRTVAIKVARTELMADAESKKRLLREAQAAASLDHANICVIYEIGEAAGINFIAMEYVEGTSLNRIIERGKMEIVNILDIAIQIAEALDEAHEKSLIHRDIKPANIMVTERGKIKVTDFGVAKLTKSDMRKTTVDHLTQEGELLGTLAYMSPEQARSERLDHRSDIFSFGIVLYEMVTGKLPFEGSNNFAIVDAILHKPAEPTAGYRSETPLELEKIVKKMLAKERDQRYQTVKEVAIDLRELREQMKTPAQEIKQTKRGYRARLGFMVGLLVLAAVGLAIWLYYSPHPVLPFAERDWILLADFDNQTGESVFDRTLKQALIMSLEQSPHCNVYPREKIRESLRRMRKETEHIDESLAREICQRERIRALLLGNIDSIDGDYLLTVKIVDPGTGKVVRPIMVRAKGRRAVVDRVEELAKQIRGSLGEALNSIAKSNKRLEEVTTASLEALKFYSLGVEQNAEGKCKEAVPLFRAAIERDTAFASAYRGLAGAYRNCGNMSEARNYATKAFELREKVTDREQFHIQALYYLIFDQYEQAIESFKLLVKRYPDDLAGHANLGSLYYELGQFNKGIEESREALRINPDPTIYADIALASLYLSNYDESIRYATLVLHTNPQNIAALLVLALDYLGKGEIERATEQCTRMMASEEVLLRLKGNERLATVLSHQGKISEAIRALQTASLISEKNNFKPFLAQDHILMAILQDLAGDKQKVFQELDKVLELVGGAEDEYLDLFTMAIAGKFYALNGDLTKAQEIIDKLAERLKEGRSNQKKVLTDLVQGEIELASRNYPAAIHSFQAAATNPTQYSYFQVQESLARAYFAAQDYNKAISIYEAAIKQKGGTLNYWTGLPHYWITAHYWLARAYEQKGLTQKAIETYHKFVDLWEEADANLPWLQEAKIRLQALKAR